MRILFLGSGPFGLPTLDSLAASCPERLEVATVPDAARGRRSELVPTVIKERALQHGLPCHEIATLKKPTGLELLDRCRTELVVTCDIRLILTRSFLVAPRRGCFNLHGSLLPRYRGAAPVARGVLAGDSVFGVTLYRMVRELDAGPMVGRRAYEPGAKIDTTAAEERLSHLAAELLLQWLPRLTAGDAPEQAQDDSLATLAPKIEKQEGRVTWRAPADSIEDHVLAMRPWPRSSCCWQRQDGGKPVLLFLDRVLPISGEAPPRVPGTVRAVNPSGPDAGIDVACGPDGAETIRLLEIQRAGKRSLPVGEFLRGTPVGAGDVLLSEQGSQQ